MQLGCSSGQRWLCLEGFRERFKRREFGTGVAVAGGNLQSRLLPSVQQSRTEIGIHRELVLHDVGAFAMVLISCSPIRDIVLD